LENDFSAEGWQDEKVLPRKPGKETITDQAMSKMCRQQTQGASVWFEAEVVPQAYPSGSQRAVTVNNSLGITGGSGREQDQRRLV
jgi:hypothetical protein